MAAFELTLHGRFWVTPEEVGDFKQGSVEFRAYLDECIGGASR